MEENNNGTPAKKSKKGLVLIIAIIAIAVLAGLAFYFMKPAATPKDVFVGGIEKVFESSSKKLGEDIKKLNTTVSLSGNIESSNESISKIAQYINQGKLTYNVKLDTEAKKALINLSVDYQNDNLINGKLYYASGDENVYIFVQDLFDKYFKVNINDATGDTQSLASLESLFTGEVNTQYGKVNSKKASEIIANAIKKNLKDEYFSKEEVDSLTKNTMLLTIGEFKTLAKNVVTELKDNQEFIGCFENKEKIKEDLDETVNEFAEISAENDNKHIELSIYTQGRSNEFKKLSIRVEVEESKNLSIALTEIEKDKYELIADIPDFGKADLNIEVKEEEPTEIENVNTEESVDVNSMTQVQQIQILSNLTKMKIYQYLAPFMSSGY